MRKVSSFLIIGMLASGSLVVGQSTDVARVLADVRQVLGGEGRLTAVKTLSASGTSTRVNGETSMPPTDFDMAIELPDKFVRTDVLATLGAATITRTSGFNGDAVIDVVDRPPSMPGMIVFRGSGAPGGAPGAPITPEQQEAARKASLTSSRQDFARLMLGLFATSSSVYPVSFSYAGQAESPDGKADIIDVRGDDDFAMKLFVDEASHLPLMASWMAKEPLTMATSTRPGGPGPTVIQRSGASQMTPEERDRLMKDMEERMKEADAKRRVVEYRLYYGDYRDVSGVKIPMRLQRSIDGKPVEETVIEKVRVNAKIDPKKFEASSGGTR